jgi:hypothetical protein
MEIRLRKNETMSIKGDSRQLSISCHQGEFWLTQKGDPNDYLIETGQDFTVNRKGKVVIVALSSTSVIFDSAFLRNARTFEKIGTLLHYGKVNFFGRRLWRGFNG